MSRHAKEPRTAPVGQASGYRDWWDGPDETLVLRAAIEAEDLRRRDQVRIERASLRRERRKRSPR